MKNIYILLTIMFILILPVTAMRDESIKDPVIYKIIIDMNYGFVRMYEMYDHYLGKEINSKNGILNISKGDSIIFVSDSDKRLILISNEKLWDEKVLQYSGKEFRHDFNNSGTYNFYLKE